MAEPVEVTIVQSDNDARELDKLLWQTLWQPLGFPRDVRHQFMIQGDAIELCAKLNGRIVGGLIAVRTNDKELELRHMAVAAPFQRSGVGRSLVAELVRMAASKDCTKIRTIARNTSTGFFRKMEFEKTQQSAPEHPVFLKHGIRLEIMDRNVEPSTPGDAAKPRTFAVTFGTAEKKTFTS